jgi:hypothetical protein
MDGGFGQLIWVIIFVIFLVTTVLKNRARMKSGPAREKARGQKMGTTEGGDRLSKFFEEIFVREEPKRKPRAYERKQQIKPLEKKPRTEPKSIDPKPKGRNKIGETTSSLAEQREEEKKSLHLKKEESFQKERLWEINSKEDLQGAIVIAEILGPPIAKRKNHRLF